MKNIFILIFLFLTANIFCQENTGIIYPGSSFTNEKSDTIFYLPKQKIKILMEREEIRKEIIINLENRVDLCDSINLLKTEEAAFWHSKLLETNNILEEVEITHAKEKNKSKLYRKVLFGVGVVLGWVVGGLV